MRGAGIRLVEMDLPNVFVNCESCNGKGNRDTLE